MRVIVTLTIGEKETVLEGEAPIFGRDYGKCRPRWSCPQEQGIHSVGERLDD